MRILIFLLLLLPSALSADDFKAYLAYTNKAESALVQDNYIQAQQYYDSAFKAWNKPFAIDISNALKCANLNKDDNTVTACATRLINLGCPLSYFQDAEYLLRYRGTVQWRSVINIYPMLRMRYSRSMNLRLRTEIEQMQAKDQFFRQQDHNYTFLKDSTYRGDDTAKAWLMKTFTHKFPNEYDYGVFLQDDTTLMDYEPLHIIILHNWGKFNDKDVTNGNPHTLDFTQVLTTAVEKGQMHPEDFAMLDDRSGEFKHGAGYGQEALLWKLKGGLYYEKTIQKIGDSIEANRKSIGLCTREEGRAKLIYDKTKNTNKFILRKSLFGIISFGGAELFNEKQIKNMFVDTGVKLDK